mmetsp:Transcript_40959/g.95687  ORF Transcript_40959/g.95687 Transcript_40959/m.95687 type:complete len:196 (+) Transcript_40959:520-1107(+)
MVTKPGIHTLRVKFVTTGKQPPGVSLVDGHANRTMVFWWFFRLREAAEYLSANGVWKRHETHCIWKPCPGILTRASASTTQKHQNLKAQNGEQDEEQRKDDHTIERYDVQYCTPYVVKVFAILVWKDQKDTPQRHGSAAKLSNRKKVVEAFHGATARKLIDPNVTRPVTFQPHQKLDGPTGVDKQNKRPEDTKEK